MASCAILSSLPDEDLVRRSRKGDDDAFSLLYHRYRGRVLRTANRIMRNPEDAQDATQEIFLKTYLSLRRWDSDRSRLSTWIYRLAANHSIDCWRARQRRARTEATEDLSADKSAFYTLSDSGSVPDRELERKEQAEEFLRYISLLPRLQRRFVILRHYYGLSLEEIASREGRSLGTVKGSLYRATRSIGRRLLRGPLQAKYPKGSRKNYLAFCCRPPGPLARRERPAIPGVVCEERATKPAGLRGTA